MKNILVTGANGFIGKNLIVLLKTRPDVRIFEYDITNTDADLNIALSVADVIVHLAGVNRPEREEEFFEGNANFIDAICQKLRELNRTPKIILTSSIQAEKDNAYGKSKLAGENALKKFSDETGAAVVIFRLKNVFGKWCRPNYNSVVATFCHNIVRGIPITVSNPQNEVPLVYIDDVIAAFIEELESENPTKGCRFGEVPQSYSMTLAELVAMLNDFRDSRHSLIVPVMNNSLTKKMLATYLSYLPDDEFAYNLTPKHDDRGSLAEFIKSPAIGQMFISRTNPGVTRGNHYHHTKVEKFLVVEGKAIIRFRSILNGSVLEYPINGRDYRVVDIPPGYTHSIENVGDGEMVVLFWASELFNPDHPDTTFKPVIE